MSKWMNEWWTIEWMNEWTNEWMNEWMNENGYYTLNVYICCGKELHLVIIFRE